MALGQHEIDFRFTDALRTADNVITLKSTVKALAAQHGLVATFMPKPIFGINGSGMHTHQSIFNDRGENVFYDPDDEFQRWLEERESILKMNKELNARSARNGA